MNTPGNQTDDLDPIDLIQINQSLEASRINSMRQFEERWERVIKNFPTGTEVTIFHSEGGSLVSKVVGQKGTVARISKEGAGYGSPTGEQIYVTVQFPQDSKHRVLNCMVTPECLEQETGERTAVELNEMLKTFEGRHILLGSSFGYDDSSKPGVKMYPKGYMKKIPGTAPHPGTLEFTFTKGPYSGRKIYALNTTGG